MFFNAVESYTVKMSESVAMQRYLPLIENALMFCFHKAAESGYLSSHVQKGVFENDA